MAASPNFQRTTNIHTVRKVFSLSCCGSYETGEISNQYNESINSKVAKLKPSWNCSRGNVKQALLTNTNSIQANQNKDNGQTYTSKTLKACSLCSLSNLIYSCEQFNNMTVGERMEIVVKHKLCFNCLRSNHVSRQCKFPNCAKCSKRHNIKLHEDPIDANTISNSAVQLSEPPTSNVMYIEQPTAPVLSSS